MEIRQFSCVHVDLYVIFLMDPVIYHQLKRRTKSDVVIECSRIQPMNFVPGNIHRPMKKYAKVWAVIVPISLGIFTWQAISHRRTIKDGIDQLNLNRDLKNMNASEIRAFLKEFIYYCKGNGIIQSFYP